MNIQMISPTHYVANVAADWLPERHLHIIYEKDSGWLGTSSEGPFIWEWETLEEALESCLLEWEETVENTSPYSDPYCDCGERLHYDPDNNWEVSNCNKCCPP